MAVNDYSEITGSYGYSEMTDSYGEVYSLIYSWVIDGKLDNYINFDDIKPHRNTFPNSLDHMLFAAGFVPTVSGQPTWLDGPHGLTLLKIKLIKAGYGTQS